MVSRLKTTEADEPDDGWGILQEVALAEALESMEPQAAMMFEQRYMPRVSTFARQVAGSRGEDLVENFAATLVMPRDSAPPRIRQYQGKTSLLKWLRVVVTNFCLSHLRRKQPLTLEAVPENSAREPATPQENRKCLELLNPVIAKAIGRLDPADRLLIKMLLLDDVPQHQVAKSLGIHSGNVTRRKQKAMDAIWCGIRSPQPEGRIHAEFRDCMETVVAGDDQLLTNELATLLASAFGRSGEPVQKGSPP